MLPIVNVNWVEQIQTYTTVQKAEKYSKKINIMRNYYHLKQLFSM